MNEFHLTLPNDAFFLSSLRHELGTWLRETGVDDRHQKDLVLAAHEAAANAIEHSETSDPVWVDAFFSGGEITVEVHHNGQWASGQAIGEEPERGLGLMESLVSDVEILTDPHGTTLRLLCPSVLD